jgi:putative ABC transport system permease protein
MSVVAPQAASPSGQASRALRSRPSCSASSSDSTSSTRHRGALSSWRHWRWIHGVLPALRTAVWQVVPDQPLFSLQTLEDRLLSSLAPRRFNSQLFSAAACVALALVLLGTYGLVSYASRQRMPEVAVRIALGGQRDDVIRLLVLSGMAWVAAGIVVGLAVAVVVAHTLRAMLYGIGPTDPGILLAVPLLLAAAAAVASYFPARRATTVDPAATLLRDGQR